MASKRPGVRLIAAVGYQVGRLFLLAIVCWVILMFYWFASAETRVQALCAEISAGMPVAELNRFASRNGLRPPVVTSGGTSFLVEAKTFGRHGCRVETADGMVRSVDYSFAD
jgi:hypothetical protein